MGGRETALNALIACRKNGAWSNGVLKEYITRDRLDSRDGALATRLCYGVLQNRLKLDFYLEQLLSGKVKNLHPVVRDILHLGLYQLYEMDRIPQSAAVNESVALARRYCKKQSNAPGLVNAVLRRAVQEKDNLTQPKSYVEKYSHPQALVNLLKNYVGKDCLEGMLIANNAAPQTVIQVNTLKTSTPALQEIFASEGVQSQPHGWMKDCLVLSNTGNLERLASFREGLFYVQDPAARLSVLCAGVSGAERVLDCCAAPGGKSFAAAMEMGHRGSILSCDVYGHKAGLIASGAARLRIGNITARQQDATQPVKSWLEAMDVVLCDVPCSGYGIIRKKPDIRYKPPDSMKALPELQQKILQNQAQYVKKGGILLYSTCTLVWEENEGNVEAFLKNHPDFDLETLELPEIFPKNQTGMLRLIPGQYDTDGFFIAKLRRKS